MVLADITIVVELLPIGSASSCGVSTPEKSLYEVTATWSGFDLVFQGLRRPDDLQSWCMDPPQPLHSGRPFMVLAPVPASDPAMSLMFMVDNDPDWLWFDLS